MENEKDFEEVLKILIPVLKDCENPLSVSYLNLQFVGKFQIKNAINERFMKLFKDQFIFYAVGDDIKIKLRYLNDPTIIEMNEKEKEVKEIKKMVEKNSKKIDSIKETMKSEMVLEKFIEEFASNKYPISLPFILRNSDSLQFYLKEEETFVNLVDENGNRKILEDEFWTYIENEGLKKFVLENVLNIFRKFKGPLNQGLLQSCFNFGNLLIDKKFMNEYMQYFSKEDETLFKLKDEYRNVAQDNETNAGMESEVSLTESSENNIQEEDGKNSIITNGSNSTLAIEDSTAENLGENNISERPSTIDDNVKIVSEFEKILKNKNHIQMALNQKHSMIIVGEDFNKTSLLIDFLISDEKSKRRMLLKLRDAIDREMNRLF